MDKTEHYVFLSSNDSSGTNTANTPFDFTVSLPTRIILEGGPWSCALLQASFKDSSPEQGCGMMIFLCDLVEESYIRDHSLPVLDIAYDLRRRKKISQVIEIANPLYHPITRKYIDSIRVWIKDELTLSDCTDLVEPVRCILHLKKLS